MASWRKIASNSPDFSSRKARQERTATAGAGSVYVRYLTGRAFSRRSRTSMLAPER